MKQMGLSYPQKMFELASAPTLIWYELILLRGRALKLQKLGRLANIPVLPMMPPLLLTTLPPMILPPDPCL